MMKLLQFLYHTAPGRLLLKPLVGRRLSAFCGRMLDRKLSRILIPGFIRRTGISVEDFDLSGVRSFNDFFCRPLKDGKRPIDTTPEALIAPCDAALTAVPVRRDTVIAVKQSRWTLCSLLRDPVLAKEFEGGLCLIFRLQVADYHRYCWFDSGQKGRNVFLPGMLHTVRPIALEDLPVFALNSREYTVLESEHFGKAIQAEVGALLVGRIANICPEPAKVRRGEEKGHFEYGGSTILLLLKAGTAELRPELSEASARGIEMPVRMGERIGRSMLPEACADRPRTARCRNDDQHTEEHMMVRE